MAKRRTVRMVPEDQRLPSGFVTKDIRRYTSAWVRLAMALGKFFNRCCIGTGENFELEGGRNPTRLMPEDAIKIWELINKKKWKD